MCIRPPLLPMTPLFLFTFIDEDVRKIIWGVHHADGISKHGL